MSILAASATGMAKPIMPSHLDHPLGGREMVEMVEMAGIGDRMAAIH
jgi:hypothetical protein